MTCPTQDFRLHADPLIATKGLRGGIDAVLGGEDSVADHIGARECTRWPWDDRRWASAEELDFDRDREVLILAHGLRRLAVDHDAAVAEGPGGSAFRLFADEAVFDGDDVVRELRAL